MTKDGRGGGGRKEAGKGQRTELAEPKAGSLGWSMRIYTYIRNMHARISRMTACCQRACPRERERERESALAHDASASQSSLPRTSSSSSSSSRTSSRSRGSEDARGGRRRGGQGNGSAVRLGNDNIQHAPTPPGHFDARFPRSAFDPAGVGPRPDLPRAWSARSVSSFCVALFCKTSGSSRTVQSQKKNVARPNE